MTPSPTRCYHWMSWADLPRTSRHPFWCFDILLVDIRALPKHHPDSRYCLFLPLSLYANDYTRRGLTLRAAPPRPFPTPTSLHLLDIGDHLRDLGTQPAADTVHESPAAA